MAPGISWDNGLHEKAWSAWPSGSTNTLVQEDPANLHFCLTGSGGDGNGNSRSQPPRGTDLNGMSSSPSVRNQPQGTTQISKLCLWTIKMLHTTHPFPELSGAPVEGHRGPWEASPPSVLSMDRTHRGGTAEPLHIHLQGFSSQGAWLDYKCTELLHFTAS